MFSDLEISSSCSRVKVGTLFRLVRVLILHRAYLWFQIAIPNFLLLKYSNFNVFWDLEVFVRVHLVSTLFMLDYVHIWHTAYLWFQFTVTKKIFIKIFKF